MTIVCGFRCRSASVLAVAAVACVTLSGPVRAQSPSPPPAAAGKKSSPSGPAASPRPWKAPRTPWGHPDLQGVWNNGTITPLERPGGDSRSLLSDDEVAVVDEQEAGRARAENRPKDRAADLELAYNQEWWDRGVSIGRTSLITDPPDGRLPPLTEEGKRRRDAYDRARRARGPADAATDRSLYERCLVYRTVPPLPTGYNNNYRILQTPTVIAILQEQIHDTRFIYLDGRPHLGSRVRQWLGDSRGHWDGETLVVETTNFNPQIEFFRFQAASETLRVVERITRVGPNEIDYRFTVYDPTTYTRPWSGILPMRTEPGLMYEYACHEGNYGIRNVLSGYRTQEQDAQGAGKASPR